MVVACGRPFFDLKCCFSGKMIVQFADIFFFVDTVFRFSLHGRDFRLKNPFFQQKGAEMREGVDFSVETYVFITEFDAVFYVGILFFFDEFVQ